MRNQDLTSRIIQPTSFQKEGLYREILDFTQFNEIVSDTSVSICPVCGIMETSNVKKAWYFSNQRKLEWS